MYGETLPLCLFNSIHSSLRLFIYSFPCFLLLNTSHASIYANFIMFTTWQRYFKQNKINFQEPIFIVRNLEFLLFWRGSCSFDIVASRDDILTLKLVLFMLWFWCLEITQLHCDRKKFVSQVFPSNSWF